MILIVLPILVFIIDMVFALFWKRNIEKVTYMREDVMFSGGGVAIAYWIILALNILVLLFLILFVSSG